MRLRSILFTPASRIDRVARGRAAGPDLLAIDLEDGVGTAGKDSARRELAEYARTGYGGHRRATAVRINALSTPDGIRDMAGLLECAAWPAMIILPKVESGAEIRQLLQLLSAASEDTVILATLETATGVARAERILPALPPGSATAYGSADHMAETGGNGKPVSLAWGRGKVTNAAAMARIPALDGAWLDFRDDPGLAGDCELARSMGFAGKIAIHPDQIRTIHDAFAPAAAEMETARAMLAAQTEAGGGAFSFRGRMVDAPVLTRARRIADLGDMESDNHSHSGNA